jgi:hypothetical protein
MQVAVAQDLLLVVLLAKQEALEAVVQEDLLAV